VEIERLDMTKVKCPICEILMIREENEVKCPKCGFASPIILVNHRVGYEERNKQLYNYYGGR